MKSRTIVTAANRSLRHMVRRIFVWLHEEHMSTTSAAMAYRVGDVQRVIGEVRVVTRLRVRADGAVEAWGVGWDAPNE